MKQKIWKGLVALLVLSLLPTAAFADSITISDTFDVFLSGSNITLKVYRGGDGIDLMTVDENSVTFVLPLGASIEVGSESGYDLPNNRDLPVICASGATKIIITTGIPVAVGDRTFTITPTAARTPCVGGGRSSSGVGSTNSAPAPSASPSEAGLPVQISDITPKGSSALPVGAKEDILKIIQKMEKNNTFNLPENKEFNPLFKTTRFFAMQVALGIAGKECGTTINFETCLDAATNAKIVDPNNLPDRFITRSQFYEMLLKAVEIRSLRTSSLIKAYLCTDVLPEDPSAAVVATARYHRIAPLYKGNRCNAALAFPRYAAMSFAADAVAAKAKNYR